MLLVGLQEEGGGHRLEEEHKDGVASVPGLSGSALLLPSQGAYRFCLPLADICSQALETLRQGPSGQTLVGMRTPSGKLVE